MTSCLCPVHLLLRPRRARILGVIALVILALTLSSAPAVVPPPQAAAQPSPSPATWMGDLRSRIGHLPLNQLALPGTHDAATYAITAASATSTDPSIALDIHKIGERIEHHGGELAGPALRALWDSLAAALVKPIVASWSKAQGLTISEQLEAGVRYFDIRPCPRPASGTQFWTCHGLYGSPVSEVLSAAKQFSQTHPHEIIILDFNHVTVNGADQNQSAELARNITGTLGTALIPQTLRPSSTMDELWGQPGRIIVLYNDQSVFTNSSVDSSRLWRGQDIESRRVRTPWPEVNNVPDQKARAQEFFDCRCEKPSDPAGSSAATTLFVLQTNPTPDIAVIGGSLLRAVKDAAHNPLTGICELCPVLELVRSELGWPSGPPQDLRDLARSANRVMIPAVRDWVLANRGQLRNHLNIVQADWFQEKYEISDVTVGGLPSISTVPSGLVDLMIQLNTPPQSTLTIGNPQYPQGAPQPFVSSSTPFTLTATDTNWGVRDVRYRYSLTNAGSPPTFTVVTGNTTSFRLTGPDGLYRIETFATNLAGVEEMVHTQLVTLDTTPPALTFANSGRVGSVRVTATDPADVLTLSCTDHRPGLQVIGTGTGTSVTRTLRYAGTGWHAITCTATDGVGNTTPATMFGVFAIGAQHTATQADPPLDFASARAGSPGECATRTVILNNDATQSFNLNSTSLSGTNAVNFSLLSGIGPGRLLPGQGRVIAIRFCPSVVGAHRAALIFRGSLGSGAGAPTPSTIPMTGTGTASSP